MNLVEWAKNEVELACRKERMHGDGPDGFDYGCACYQSALKAFECLMEDGHSGMSINITKHILNRLIDGKPLTPIEDTDDVWSDIQDISGLQGERVNYQCKRMSSLFKYVYNDGTVTYRDINRVVCSNKDTPESTYYFGFISKIIDDMYPITMPYNGSDKYRVTTMDFLYDPKNGDFDTIGVIDVIKPNGTTQSINRYFKEDNHDLVEIDETEFYDRYTSYLRKNNTL